MTLQTEEPLKTVQVFTSAPVSLHEREPDPIDVDDPVAISHRLGAIEDRIAVLGPRLGYVKGRMVELKHQRRRVELALWPTLPVTKLAKDREALIQKIIENGHQALEDDLVAAESWLEMLETEMRTLEKRLSALQSALKTHNDGVPKHGKGA